MVHITRLPTFLFLSVLATCFLASLVKSAEMECESIVQTIDPSEKVAKYIVFLKPENNNHKEWLRKCYGYTMKTTISSDDDEKTAYGLTSMNAYIATFPKALVNVLSKHKEIQLMEKDAKITISYAVPNNIFKRATRNNPEENLDRIDQAKGTNKKYNFPDSAGKGVNIFVVDTGVNIKHSEFDGGRAKFGASFCFLCNDEDENGHGTHVASTAAGKTVGVANKANVIAVRVFDAIGGGKNSEVIAGLNFVLKQHKNAKNKNSIANLSLSGRFSAAINTAVKKLTDAGVHVVVAAGNKSRDACKSSPASEPSVITVGATNSSDDTISSISNNGKCVDLFAPGVDIKGADTKKLKGFVVLSGTSQATPHVAGTVALLISKDGNKPPADMAKAIIGLSTKGVISNAKDNKLNGAPNDFLRVPAP